VYWLTVAYLTISALPCCPLWIADARSVLVLSTGLKVVPNDGGIKTIQISGTSLHGVHSDNDARLSVQDQRLVLAVANFMSTVHREGQN
jgi:hypothetical protein